MKMPGFVYAVTSLRPMVSILAMKQETRLSLCQPGDTYMSVRVAEE